MAEAGLIHHPQVASKYINRGSLIKAALRCCANYEAAGTALTDERLKNIADFYRLSIEDLKYQRANEKARRTTYTKQHK